MKWRNTNHYPFDGRRERARAKVHSHPMSRRHVQSRRITVFGEKTQHVEVCTVHTGRYAARATRARAVRRARLVGAFAATTASNGDRVRGTGERRRARPQLVYTTQRLGDKIKKKRNARGGPGTGTRGQRLRHRSAYAPSSFAHHSAVLCRPTASTWTRDSSSSSGDVGRDAWTRTGRTSRSPCLTCCFTCSSRPPSS